MAQIRDGGFLINLLALPFKEKSHDLFVLFLYTLLFLGGRAGAGFCENVTNTLLGRSGVS